MTSHHEHYLRSHHRLTIPVPDAILCSEKCIPNTTVTFATSVIACHKSHTHFVQNLTPSTPDARARAHGEKAGHGNLSPRLNAHNDGKHQLLSNHDGGFPALEDTLPAREDSLAPCCASCSRNPDQSSARDSLLVVLVYSSLLSDGLLGVRWKGEMGMRRLVLEAPGRDSPACSRWSAGQRQHAICSVASERICGVPSVQLSRAAIS